MGFTTGFVGGLAATYTLLYMSLHLHRSNRQHQSLLLTQQKTLLTSIYEPQIIITDSPAYEVRKAGIAEELKDRWNRELENVVRNLQNTDWEEVRVRWEKRVGNVWANIKASDVGKEVKDAGQRISDNVVGAAEDVKKEVKDATGERRLLELK